MSTENSVASNWLKGFIDSLERILDKPPYLVFVFISAIFLVVSLIARFHYEQSWIFFLYSAFGSMWRYVEKDFINHLAKYPQYPHSKITIISIYHLGNIALFIVLIYFLYRI